MYVTLNLILGLLIGFYGRSIYDKVNQLYAEFVDRREARQVGVVRPVGTPITKNVPIDMTSETGGIRKPSPAEIEDQRQEDRARILQESHR